MYGSMRYVPSSYCPDKPIQDEVQVQAAGDPFEAPVQVNRAQAPRTPARVAFAPGIKEVSPVKNVAPAKQPEPVFSSYAAGVNLPPGYGVQYQSPTMYRRPPTPAHTPIQEAAPSPVQYSYDQQPTYHEQTTVQEQKVRAPKTPTRPISAPARSSRMLSEPSAYAFGQLNDTYANELYEAPGAKNSGYAFPSDNYEAKVAEIEQERVANAKACASPYNQSTMESTQIYSAQPGAPSKNSAPAQVPQARWVEPAKPQASHRPMQMMPSAYVGGVPNDMFNADEKPNPAYAYQQTKPSFKKEPSRYHFEQSSTPQAMPHHDVDTCSVVTADVEPLPSEPLNLQQMTRSIQEIQRQLPGRAFAPLDVAPCSEYQFDQLQDLASYI